MASQKQLSRRSAKLAVGTAETALAVPMVMGMRLWQMALAGSNPTAKDQREYRRMVSEKQAAASEAWMAMAQQWLTVSQQLALASWQLWWKPALSHNGMANFTRAVQLAGLDMTHSGVTPIQKKVRANLKRLSR